MSDPLPLGKKALFKPKNSVKAHQNFFKNNSIIFAALMLLLFGSMLRLLGSQTTAEAYADSERSRDVVKLESPLFAEKTTIFEAAKDKNDYLAKQEIATVRQEIAQDGSNELFSAKLNSIVGETPIKEMVPFISQRDQRVAAFLVGMAKKESDWGRHVPTVGGKDCYNYWGYKGQGGRGSAAGGYACFGSAQEAVSVVGDRIEALVNKERNTPQRMVDTWKCGTSCKGDPGAPGWVATVALYFEKIIG